MHQIPVLQSLPANVLRALSASSRPHEFRKGDVIFEEGKPADAVWIIKSGWVALTKASPDGISVTIFAMTPRQMICGISAFDEDVYSATAVAAVDSKVLEIPASEVLRLLSRYPEFTRAVMRACCQRIRQMAETISLARSTAEQRLAGTLLRLRRDFGDVIPVTHQDLARMAGIRWETSIRTIAGMRRKGWLASARRQVTILKPDCLQEALRCGNHAGRHRIAGRPLVS